MSKRSAHCGGCSSLALCGRADQSRRGGADQAEDHDLGPDFPKTEIFIGNSFFYYNNSMHSHVLAMQRAADPDHKRQYRATSVTISGSGFDWHDVESYFRPNAIGNYSFDDNNNIVFNKLDKFSTSPS